jgi:uncharacterized RDD family membrane protein YckC
VGTLQPTITSTSLPFPSPAVNRRALGALWRRLVAALADVIILGVAINLLALPFFNVLSRIGAWGGLIGFCVSFPYFAILNSRIGDGQTLGKRWMNLRVIDSTGESISFGQSSLRYLVLAFPWFLDAISMPVVTPQILQYLVSTIVLIAGGGTLYLVLFNRHTRQGLHDLAVKSFVADTGQSGQLSVPPIWAGHWIILGSLLCLYFVAMIFTGIFFGNRLSQFTAALERIESLNHVYAAGLNDLTWHTFGKSGSEHILVVTVRWSGTSDSESAAADQIAELILDHFPQADQRDAIRIIFDRGYSLGIASLHSNNIFQHTPSEWRQRLGTIQQKPTNQL